MHADYPRRDLINTSSHGRGAQDLGLAIAIAGGVLGFAGPVVDMKLILNLVPFGVSEIITFTGLSICIAWSGWVHAQAPRLSSLMLMWLLLSLNGTLMWATGFVVAKYMLPGFALQILSSLLFLVTKLRST